MATRRQQTQTCVCKCHGNHRHQDRWVNFWYGLNQCTTVSQGYQNCPWQLEDTPRQAGGRLFA